MTWHDLLNVIVFFALSCVGGVVIYRLPVKCKQRVDCGPERRANTPNAIESEFLGECGVQLHPQSPGVQLRAKSPE